MVNEAAVLRKDENRGDKRITRIIPITKEGEALVETDAFGEPMGTGGVITVK